MFSEQRIDQVYLALGATDLRKSIDGLSLIVSQKFKLDPFSRNLYVFCNRKQDKIKILEWSPSGFWLHYKRLEKDKFFLLCAITHNRKNFLFSKSPKGATASGIAYSIIETAKANNLVAFKYLTYLFEQLPNIDLNNYDALDALLPWSKNLPEELSPKTESSED